MNTTKCHNRLQQSLPKNTLPLAPIKPEIPPYSLPINSQNNHGSFRGFGYQSTFDITLFNEIKRLKTRQKHLTQSLAKQDMTKTQLIDIKEQYQDTIQYKKILELFFSNMEKVRQSIVANWR